MFVLAAIATSPLESLGAEIVPQAESPEGWTVSRVPTSGGDIPVCQGEGPQSGDAQLSILTEGPQLMLLITAPALPRSKGEYGLSLSINDGPTVSVNAVGSNTTLAIPMSHDLSEALTVASKLRVQVGTATYEFQVRNAGPAMEAVSRCAGMPTRAENVAHAPVPIAGAGAWTLVRPGPGQPQCSARINGPEVDTNIIFNDSGQILLIPGRPDWAAWPGEKEVELQIDDWPVEKVKADAINTIVIVRTSGEAMVERLRRASTLRWQMPAGKFTADVLGIGVAIEALKACEDIRRGVGR